MPSSSLTAPVVGSATRSQTGLQITIMAIAAFVIVTTEFLIIGLLPALAKDLGVSIAMAGQLVTLFAFTVMLFGPILTARLAHIDRRQLFTCILLVFAASNVLAALAPNIWVLALARFIPALLLPVFWGTASETAGQLAGPAHAGKAVANVYMGISAALVFGIPLGTLAADSVGWRGSFWILAALCLLIGLLIRLFMPALPSAPQRTTGDKQTGIFKDPRFLAHVALSTLAFTAMFTAYTYLADTLQRLAGIAPGQVGWWLMGFGAVGMLGNHFGGRLVDRSPLGSTVLFLVLLAIGMLAATPLASQHGWLIVALIVWGIAYTALFPICQVRVMRAGAKAQALAATMNISAANAGIGLGAILGGLGIRHFGLESLGMISAGIAGLAIVVALLLMRRT
ncbi:Predicted arabinose efflux permease, MFS family [Pseudomonas taetrolens]|uniref:MFS transporter n=1 Tax=Pseudomonas taetrolens TaxID=47884 RepID=A0A0J6GQU1_PSETA|nr:MFS transporter [Pseudomonas taetrolens]KMM87051.1 MFS transporter [Pseudomonas taetrolens]SEB55937.1 Predicted arabinose efflux permease, MFS family [Pseudomonas taetrolens]SQF84833.1 major facilitator transporter [Pseudomonas taetrolens]VEH46577.1 major facilitator transporter [Pseudomonas taetrolens]